MRAKRLRAAIVENRQLDRHRTLLGKWDAPIAIVPRHAAAVTPRRHALAPRTPSLMFAHDASHSAM